MTEEFTVTRSVPTQNYYQKVTCLENNSLNNVDFKLPVRSATRPVEGRSFWDLALCGLSFGNLLSNCPWT